MKKGLFISLLVLFSFFAFSDALRAQQPSLSIDPGNTDLLLTVTIFPEIPGTFEPVDVSVESYASFDINASLITWSLDGKILKKGVGEKRFSFTTGELGSISRIKISVVPPNTFPFTREIVIQPSEVDLLWEAKTYVHPFYAGKSLYSTESELVFEAVPHFINSNKGKTPISREDLIYNWSVGGYFYSAKSGYGKSSFSYKGSLLEKREVVDIVVRSADGKLSAKKSLTINPATPQVLVYENHPLYGFLYNREVGSSYTLGVTEVSFLASPYYFSTENKGLDLDFSWLMNGRPVEYSGLRNEIVLRKEDAVTGSSNVSVTVNNKSRLLQSNRKGFVVSFGSNR